MFPAGRTDPCTTDRKSSAPHVSAGPKRSRRVPGARRYPKPTARSGQCREGRSAPAHVRRNGENRRRGSGPGALRHEHDRDPVARPDGEARWTRRLPGASLPGFRPGRLSPARGRRREALLQPASLRTSGSTRRVPKKGLSGNRMHDLFMTLRTRTGRRVLANCRQDVPGSVRSD